MTKALRKNDPALRDTFVDEMNRVILFDTLGQTVAQGNKVDNEAFNRAFEFMGASLEMHHEKPSVWAYMIRRNSDGNIFAFSHSTQGKPKPNGQEHGIVFEPVTYGEYTPWAFVFFPWDEALTDDRTNDEAIADTDEWLKSMGIYLHSDNDSRDGDGR